MTTYLPVNNYYGINDCNTIYIGFWKNENTVFFLNYLFSLFFIFQHLLYFSIVSIFLNMLTKINFMGCVLITSSSEITKENN